MHNCTNWKTIEQTDLHNALPEMRPISSDGSVKELHFINQLGIPCRITANWDSLKIQIPKKKTIYILSGTLCPGVDIRETFDDKGVAEARREELTEGMVNKPELGIEEIETYQ